MSELITLEKFKQAIINSIKTSTMQEEAASGLAEHVLNFFGFQDRIIDNMLDPNDRDAFYMLEDVGLLTTEREETGLPDGREWRIHYWLMREDRILKALKSMGMKAKKDDRRQTIYDTIPDDIWFRRIHIEEEDEEEDEEDELTEADWETPLAKSTESQGIKRAEFIVIKQKPKPKPKKEEKLEGEEEITFVSEESSRDESEEE